MEDRTISLNAVMDIMHEMWGDSGELLDAIKELPPVTPNEEEMAIKYIEGYNAGFYHAQAIFQKEPKTGHWNLFHTTEHGMREDSYFKCNRCNYESYKEYNFCPNCGVNMSENPTGSESEDKE